MDRFYIITNSDKDKKLEITEKIADYLKTHHKNCEVQQEYVSNYITVDHGHINKKTRHDCTYEVLEKVGIHQVTLGFRRV